jgi:hypothetical protein
MCCIGFWFNRPLLSPTYESFKYMILCNFSLVPTVSISSRSQLNCLSLAADIKHNLSDVGFGHVTFSAWDGQFMEFSTSLGMDCYGWGVPLGAGGQPPVWMIFTGEFSYLTWVLVFIALFLASVVLWVLPRTLPRCEQQDKAMYRLPR